MCTVRPQDSRVKAGRIFRAKPRRGGRSLEGLRDCTEKVQALFGFNLCVCVHNSSPATVLQLLVSLIALDL
jgi:hypothetical protein